MGKFSIKEKLKTQIDEIWNNQMFENIEFLNRGYAVQDEIILNSILFIGINPSFTEKSLEKTETESDFYHIEQEGEAYSYFKKFQDISKKTGMTWSHLDLLFVRETNQQNVKNIFSNENGKLFITKQLELSKYIIEQSKPKVIVVSNTFARELFREDFKVEFDESIGTYIIINEELKNTPVFFTSMLTGQRAMDLGSYERLVWHIKQVLRK